MKCDLRQPPATPTQATGQVFLGTLVGWFLCVALAGYLGFFESLPAEAFPFWVILGTAVPLAVYFYSAKFQLYVDSISIERMTLLHMWRVFAAIIFFIAGSHGILPGTFVRNAGYGDMAVGLMAAIMVGIGASKRLYIAFHAVGLLDLAFAVGTGVVLVLRGEPLMTNITQFPLVVIPVFGVAATASLECMTLIRLLRSNPLPPDNTSEPAEGLPK